MRFPADENVPFGVIEELIAFGHDAEWVGKLAPGAPGGQVLRHAAMDGRIVLTFDKDYGDLAHRRDATVLPAGIVLIRSPVPRTREDCHKLARVIAARDDWAWVFHCRRAGSNSATRASRLAEAHHRQQLFFSS